MAKKAQQNKISQDSKGIKFEQQNIEDDSMLPAAEELAKLNAVDEKIVPWIMEAQSYWS